MPDNRVDTPTSVTALVGGIINDAQKLLRQEIELAKREIRQEVDKVKTAAVSFAIGGVVASLGGILLILMIVFLINWLSGDRFPLWACFGVVGGVLAVVGLGLLYAARNTASSVHLVPPQTVQTLKENVQWIKNQT